MGFIEEWLEKGAPLPEDRQRFAVKNDRWDRQRYEQMLKEMSEFVAERDALCEVAPTGIELWGDTFFALTTINTGLVEQNELDPNFFINHMVMEQALTLPELERLKKWTEGDSVASAHACITMRPQIERIYDRTKQEQERSEALHNKMQDLHLLMQEQRNLDEMIQQWIEENDPDDPELNEAWLQLQQQRQELDDKLREMMTQAEELSKELEEGLDEARATIRALLSVALREAAEEAEETARVERLWGTEPGSLTRLPAKRRLELARKMNTERFRRMAELFGAVERLFRASQQRQVEYVPAEVYDITVGRDLEQLLPGEKAKLLNPHRKLEFYKDFVEGKVMQYALRGTDNVARGGIVCCIDISGSMMGDPEVMAKGMGLGLLHLAIKQRRNFWGIHFGSSRELREFDFSQGHDIELVMDFAEECYFGGTDFQAPMTRALARIADEHDQTGRVKSDIVFITDGLCRVNSSWKAGFLKELERIDGRMWGILIGHHRLMEPLYSLCSGRVCTVGDILNPNRDIIDIFAGVS